MAGGDDDLNLSANLSGDLADALGRIEDKLGRVERALDEAGDAGESAGRKISDGADKAESGLRDTEAAAKGAARALGDVEDEAEDASKALGEAARSGREAGAGMRGAAGGADDAAAALGHTERKAKGAARALDDAGDEAIEAGAKAAASATMWERLAARMDRGDRFSRRFAKAQSLFRWSTWASGAGKVGGAMGRLVNIDFDKASKKLGNLSKKFGGFGKVLTGLKIGVVVGGLYALLGLISALGAGAAGMIGGLGAIAAGLAALGPVAVGAMVAVKSLGAAIKECEPETKRLKDQFGGLVTNIAAGGLRSGLQGLARDTVELSKRTNTLGTYIGRSAKVTLLAAGTYAKSSGFLQRFGVIADGMRTQLTDVGLTALNAGRMMVTGLAAATPAANRLTTDLLNLTTRWSQQLDAAYESGAATDYINNAYNNLRRALAVVADWVVGLYRIFRIAAQESRWMGDSIEESAQRFRDWTGTVEGENAIRKYFQDAMPAVREAGLLIRDLFMGFGAMAAGEDLAPLLNQIRTQLLPALLELASHINSNLLPGLVDLATKLATLFSGLDFSGLTVLVDMVNAFLDAVLWASENVPGFNLVLSTLLTTLFLLGPAFKIASWVTGAFGRLGQVLAWLGKLPGISIIVKNLQMLWFVIGGWPGLFASVGRGIVAVASLIGRGLAAAFLGSNPIGWIILAVIAVVGAFWWLWENCQTFRDAVTTGLSAIGDFFVWLGGVIMDALRAVGDFFVWLWQGILWPVIQAIWTGFKWLVAILFIVLVAPFIAIFKLLEAAAIWWWENVTYPVLQAVAAFFGWIFNNVILPIVNFFVNAWTLALGLIAAAWTLYLQPALVAIGAFFDWLFMTVIKAAIDFFVWAWNMALLAAVLIWVTVLQPALNAIGALFTWIFDNVIAPVIRFFMWLWDMAMLGIQMIYLTRIVPLMNAFAAIVNWLYYNIYKPVIDLLAAGWKWLSDALIGVYNNYIKPAFDAFAAALDVLKIYFDGTVTAIAAIWDRLRKATADPINFLIETVWNGGLVPAWNWVADKLGLPKAEPMQPIKMATGGGVHGPGTGTSDDVPAMLSNGEHVWTAREVRAAGGHDKVKRLRRMAVDETLQFYADGGPVTPAEMHGVVSAAIPGTRLSSAFRPGDPGFHGKNRAADLAGPRSGDGPFMRRIDEFIGSKFPGSSELIHTPGPYNIKNGSPHTYNAAVRADHYDHVHWANNGSAEGDGGGGFWEGVRQTLWDVGKPILEGMINPIIDGIPFRAPPQVLDIPRNAATWARDAMFKWAEERLVKMDGGGGDGLAEGGTGPVADQVRAVATRYGWDQGAQWANLSALINKESSWNPTAQNPTSTAYGLFQFLNGTWGTVGGRKTSNPGEQAEYGLRYIKNKYRDPIGAWSFHRAHNWYDDGGYLPTGPSLVMNGTGSPEPVFTGSQWDILAGNMLMPDNIIDALHSSPQTLEARRASVREDALAGEVRELAGAVHALAERPPPMTVNGGDDVRRAVREELEAHERRKRQRGAYQYGGK